jgi:hypothetical protein
MGLLLETDRASAPSPGAAFLLVDRDLRAQGISRAAETLFQLSEAEVVDRPLRELLRSALRSASQTEPGSAGGADPLERAAEQVLCGATAARAVPVTILTPAADNASGTPLSARVAVCGPPRAALVVLS